ncbi:MAG: (Fe-S)-binding protein [Anaerolineales bacterium]|nr:(Fe-S)-binding protein [Anaerolineales bacterium]
MLTSVEKYIFLLVLFLVIYLTIRAVRRLTGIMQRGSGKPDWRLAVRQTPLALGKALTFFAVFQSRPLVSFFHGLVGWGFLYYMLVNLGDLLTGLIPNFHFLGMGLLGDLYRLGADLLSVAVLAGMIVLMLRRYVLRPEVLKTRESTMLLPKARGGIMRDSGLVGIFILMHVGARFLGEVLQLAEHGVDPWQPAASLLAAPFAAALTPRALMIGQHICWWLAIGLIMAFIPYFPHTKHIHLIMGPLNYALHPARRSPGELDRLNFEDESIETFGVSRLEDLSWKGLLDAYACIMCNRCQDVCPAYQTGKILSPAALEINKRYMLNEIGTAFAEGAESTATLLDFALPAEAVWACTACGACIQACPVGNEPMRDILEIRRSQVLMENIFPDPLQNTFRGLERTANPWNIPPERRMDWAENLAVPTIRTNPAPDILWWVGCAPATDPRAQKTARAFAKLLEKADVNYAVLGTEERCTGDAARRAGNEYVFDMLAQENVATLNRVSPKRIVTTCPHCLHTLKHEYPAFGGHYEVVHHSELLAELMAKGRLVLSFPARVSAAAYHDPCYLGRMNGTFNAPRKVLKSAGVKIQELERSREHAFCCGAGGGQMWKEEEHGGKRVSEARLEEVRQTGASALMVACPFCLIMLGDTASASPESLEIMDIAELLAEGL